MAAKTQQKKLVDSDEKLSSGGRAQSFWAGSSISKSRRYEADDYAGELDQYEVIKKYSIKGFEYGNWLNNNDRYDFLEATAESLDNLAKILGTKNIGCDGIVGIAFGARGKTKALAHFEPHTFMINLTKLNGFGSLAHEYGHALDYFFGMYVDQSTAYTSLVGGRSTHRILPMQGGTLRRLGNKLVNDITTNAKGEKTATYERWEQTFGTKSDYWFRRNEIFARAFEQWIRYRMDKKGLKNTFLSKRKYDTAAYVLPTDFKRILPTMDKLIKEMAAFMNNKKKSTGTTRKTGLRTAAKK